MSAQESTSSTILELIKEFEGSAAPTQKESLSPYSIRFTEAERQFLDEHSGNKSWAEFIRKRVFGEAASTRRPARRPTVDDQTAGELLKELGKSRLSSNVNQLAKAANMGTLDISPETDNKLQEASEAILAMRDALFTALGLKVS